MPVTAIIQTHVVQATSIEQFRQPSGRRAYGMVYWQRCGNTMVVDCIHDHTDVQQLRKKIAEGIVYIQDKTKTP